MDSSSQDTGSAEHAEETGMDEFELVDSPPVSAMDKKSMATTAPLDQVLPQVDLDELSMSLNQPLLPARSIAFRVLFMGHRISQRQKSMILKKIGEGIAAIPSSSGGARRIPDGTPQHFQEKTHNVVILDAFNPEPVETYEDNGLHVIEADFTWGSDSVTTAADVDEEELDAYIKYHYSKSSSSSRRPNSSESAMNHKGIDLVIYLFSTTSAVYDKVVERDMRTLARLSALGVYTWPILAVRLCRSSHEQQRPPSSRNNSSSRPPTRTSYRRAMSPTSVSPTPSSSFIARGRILSGLGGVSGSSISELFQQQQQQEDESQCELAALQMALSEQLSKYPIKKVDVSGINPERPRFAAAAAATTTTTAGGGGTALTESLAPGIFLTTDQFASIDQKDMCRILSSCQTTITTTLENQRASWLSRWLLSSRLSKMLLPSFLLYDGGFSQRAILCLLLAGVLASTTFFRRSMQPLETHIAHPDLTQATVKLDPMWEVPDEYSLRHFFVVELTPLVHNLNKNTLWSNENIKIKLNTSSAITQQQEYAMSYIPGTRFKYSADVPSPCLLNSEEDFSASVEWTLYHSSTVLSIDRVTLYVDICKSVDQGRYEIQEYTPAQFADTKKRMAVYTPPSWYEEQWMQLIFHIKQYFKQLRKHLRRYF